MKKIIKKNIDESLQELLVVANGKPISLGRILTNLAGRGLPIIVIILSIPFCFPFQIPGFSTPFGLGLAFLGIRFAFGKKPWWPKFIMDKEIAYSTLETMVKHSLNVLKKMRKFVHPRLLNLSQSSYFHTLHGLWITIMSLLLAVPLPIPLSNTIAALPLFFMGLGLLEDDGVMILISYFLGLICLTIFSLIFIFGYEGIKFMIVALN